MVGLVSAWWLHHLVATVCLLAPQMVHRADGKAAELGLSVPLTARLVTRTKESMELAGWQVLSWKTAKAQ